MSGGHEGHGVDFKILNIPRRIVCRFLYAVSMAPYFKQTMQEDTPVGSRVFVCVMFGATLLHSSLYYCTVFAVLFRALEAGCWRTHSREITGESPKQFPLIDTSYSIMG